MVPQILKYSFIIYGINHYGTVVNEINMKQMKTRYKTVKEIQIVQTNTVQWSGIFPLWERSRDRVHKGQYFNGIPNKTKKKKKEEEEEELES